MNQKIRRKTTRGAAKTHRRTTERQTRKSTKSTIFPTAKQAPANDGDSGKQHKKLTKREKFERWIRVAEFAAFIAAILTAVFIGYQWHEMVKSSKIAGRQLDVMQRQLDEMKTARELDERAWVMAYDYEPQYTSNGFFVRVSFKNTGKTPAIECEGHIFWQTNRDKIPTFDIRPPPPENRSLLAPDEGGIIDSADALVPRYGWDCKWE